VFDADYRKATQHPFPAAIHDAEDVLAYLLKYPDRHDSSNIFLSGFSSGGNIAFAMACSLGPKRIKGVTGIYAILDLTKVPERNAAPAKKKKGITAAGITVPAFIYDACFNTYVPPNHSRADSRISVALAPVSSFPGHVYLACGDTDSLFEPAVKLVQRLQEAGHNDAEFVSLQGMGHGFDMPGVRGEAEVMKEKAYTGVVDMIDRALIDGSLLGGW
jgi:acetyl esterase/lipase